MKKEYEVKLDLFEGPLDLLLYLVSKAEVAIVDISVSQITAQYLQFITLMKEISIDVAGEYLHMAATLVRLKSRELLPQDSTTSKEEEEDGGIYNREQLIAQLIEYKKFKEAANSLRIYEAEQIGTFGRGSAEEPEAVDENGEKMIGNVTMFDLVAAFRDIVTREIPIEHQHVVRFDSARIDDRIEHVLSLIDDKKEVSFIELFSDVITRNYLVVTFMAVLELIKMQQIYFRQEERFGTIFVLRRPESERQEVPSEQAAQADEESLTD